MLLSPEPARPRTPKRFAKMDRCYQCSICEALSMSKTAARVSCSLFEGIGTLVYSPGRDASTAVLHPLTCHWPHSCYPSCDKKTDKGFAVWVDGSAVLQVAISNRSNNDGYRRVLTLSRNHPPPPDSTTHVIAPPRQPRSSISAVARPTSGSALRTPLIHHCHPNRLRSCALRLSTHCLYLCALG